MSIDAQSAAAATKDLGRYAQSRPGRSRKGASKHMLYRYTRLDRK